MVRTIRTGILCLLLGVFVYWGVQYQLDNPANEEAVPGFKMSTQKASLQ